MLQLGYSSSMGSDMRSGVCETMLNIVWILKLLGCMEGMDVWSFFNHELPPWIWVVAKADGATVTSGAPVAPQATSRATVKSGSWKMAAAAVS
jgi:hypothetical protein